MESKTITKIRCDVDNLQFGYYDEEKDDFVAIETQDDFEKAAEKFQCSPELIELVFTLSEAIKDFVGMDLRSIWRRMDDAGI